jgi:hypothetical protein
MSAWNLVVPFVACTSQGGPFDDEAFAEGFRCGHTSAVLNGCPQEVREVTFTATSTPAVLRQLELIGMAADFPMMEVDTYEPVPAWASVTFRRHREEAAQ